MAVNRFMTPAELPKVSFFQLPYDQMKEGIMSAQMQQDTAREGISQIGDISFNYLTNATNDVDLAKNIYGELYQKTQGILSKQGNGDLRGLRGEIYNLGKEVGRWYKPDGKIGRLQSNYLQYMDWYKRQTENKDIDKTYLNHAADAFMKAYDSKGGAKAGGIYTEDLEKLPDVPKFFNDNKDLLKAKLTQYAYANPKYRRFIAEGTDATTILSPDEIKRVMSGLLENDPTYSKFMSQANRIGYYKDEQIPLLNPIEKQYKDPKTGEIKKYIDSEVNGKNPYASSLLAVMEGLKRNDYVQTRNLKNDSGWLDLAKWEKEQKEEISPNFMINQGQPISIETDPVNYHSRFEQQTGNNIENLIIKGAKDTKGRPYNQADIKDAYINSFDIKGDFDQNKFLTNMRNKDYSPAVDKNRDNPMGDLYIVMDKIFKDSFFGGKGTISDYTRSFKKYINEKPNFVDNSNLEFSAADPENKKNEGTIFFNALSNAITGATGGGFEVVSSSLKDLDKKKIKGSDSLIQGLIGQEADGYTITGYETKVIDKKGNIKLLLKGKKKGETESVVIPNSYTVIKAPSRITEPLLDKIAVMNMKDANAYNQLGYNSTAKLSIEAAQDIATRNYNKPSTQAYRKMMGTAIGKEVDLGKEFDYADPRTGKTRNPFNEKITIKVTGFNPKTNMPYGQVYINGEPIGEEVTNEQEIKAVLIEAGKE